MHTIPFNALAWLILASTASMHVHAQTLVRPRSNSSLYYRMGGGEAAARASHKGAIAMRLGLAGSLRLNYSCGKFDVGLSWANMMNGFAALGTQVTGAVQAGIASLPMYVFQRAQPGLYELFQTYSAKADVLVAASLKSCEEMEAQIKNGQNPYEEWMGAAKADAWKSQADSDADVIKAKTNVEKNGGRAGVGWVTGQRAGGAGQAPIRVIKDLIASAYNITLNQAQNSSDAIDYQASTPLLAQSKLVRSFKRPIDAATYASDVLGDTQIGLCTEADCPPKGSTTAVGLGPKLEAEIPAVQTTINTMLASPAPDYKALDQISAPGVAISKEVIDAVRELPDVERSIAVDKLSQEIALARTIDKALTIRNLLLTAVTIPEVHATFVAVSEAQTKISVINRYIDDLLYENRVRKELVSSTASVLLDAHRTYQSQSLGTSLSPGQEKFPLSNGKVPKP
jgi:integrating conjugative element protein (TIGR03755 family)